MITRVKPDKQKSESLKKMAEITLERLDKTDMENTQATHCWIIMMLFTN